MDATGEIPCGEPFDLSEQVVGLERATGRARMMPPAPGREPPRIEGYTVGAPFLTQDPPHDGELHPDADELLYLVSGSVHVVLELVDGDRVVEVEPGQALVVPQGVWHRVVLQAPSRLVHITPGPGGQHRPLGSRG